MTLFTEEDILSQSKQYARFLTEELSNTELKFFQKIVLNSSQYRSKEELEPHLSELSKTNIPLIYVIKIDNIEHHNALLKSFRDNKENSSVEIKLSKDNEVDSSVLYVGSSTTDFKKRLKNHLGVLSGSVYSLHLSKWDDNLDYEVIVYIYEVVSKFEKVSERILTEIIEQQIWDKLQPAFGKRGGLY